MIRDDQEIVTNFAASSFSPRCSDLILNCMTKILIVLNQPYYIPKSGAVIVKSVHWQHFWAHTKGKNGFVLI